MKAPSPAFSLYPKDIESDERCKAMTHAEFGMYMRLIMNCWTEGSIPSDPIRLQRLLKVSSKTFNACWPAIEACFTPSGDRLIQSRLEEERTRQRERSLLNSERGRKGGKPLKPTPDIKPRLYTGFTESKPDQSLPSPSPSSIATADEQIDLVRSEFDGEEKRLTGLLLPIRNSGGDVQAVLDSLPRKLDRSAFSAYTWLRSGRSGVPVNERGLTVLRLTNDALEARQRGQTKPRKGAAPSWDRGIDHPVSDDEINAWDARLGPRPRAEERS